MPCCTGKLPIGVDGRPLPTIRRYTPSVVTLNTLPAGLIAVAGRAPTTYGMSANTSSLVAVLVHGVALWASVGVNAANWPNESGPSAKHCWLRAQVRVEDPLRAVRRVVKESSAGARDEARVAARADLLNWRKREGKEGLWQARFCTVLVPAAPRRVQFDVFQ